MVQVHFCLLAKSESVAKEEVLLQSAISWFDDLIVYRHLASSTQVDYLDRLLI